MDRYSITAKSGYIAEFNNEGRWVLYEDIDPLQQELLAYRDMVDRLNGRCEELEKVNQLNNVFNSRDIEDLKQENERLKELLKVKGLADGGIVTGSKTYLIGEG